MLSPISVLNHHIHFNVSPKRWSPSDYILCIHHVTYNLYVLQTMVLHTWTTFALLTINPGLSGLCGCSVHPNPNQPFSIVVLLYFYVIVLCCQWLCCCIFMLLCCSVIVLDVWRPVWYTTDPEGPPALVEDNPEKIDIFDGRREHTKKNNLEIILMTDKVSESLSTNF